MRAGLVSASTPANRFGAQTRRAEARARTPAHDRTREGLDMASQKLVRCEIRRRGSSGPTSPRFIPLQTFGLWEYLMTTKHDFDVIEPRAPLWLAMEDPLEAAHRETQNERVTEVTACVYSGRDEMSTRG